jgi:hypothetical protein
MQGYGFVLLHRASAIDKIVLGKGNKCCRSGIHKNAAGEIVRSIKNECWLSVLIRFMSLSFYTAHVTQLAL